MTVKEFYAAIGGNYDEAVRRFSGEALTVRFLGKFEGAVDFGSLEKSIADENWEAAFAAAHTLKGVSLNMAFARLSACLSELTDMLRTRPPADDPRPLLGRVMDEYRLVVSLIPEERL